MAEAVAEKKECLHPRPRQKSRSPPPTDFPPTLDSLRSVSITFTNVFAAPARSPSRAAMLTGKYGVNNGVTGVPGNELTG